MDLNKEEIFFVNNVIVAKRLLRLGHVIVDLRKDKFNESKTNYVFKNSPMILQDMKDIKKVMFD